MSLKDQGNDWDTRTRAAPRSRQQVLDILHGYGAVAVVERWGCTPHKLLAKMATDSRLKRVRGGVAAR